MSRRAFAIAVAVVLAVAAAGLWLLGREATLQWAARELVARSAGKLALDGVGGSLLSRIHVDRASWHGQANTVEAVDVDVAWSPLWLLAGTAAFDHAHAHSVAVASAAGRRGPARLPEELRLPLRVRVEDAGVDMLTVSGRSGEARAFRDVAASFAGAPDRWSMKLAGVRTTWGTLRGEATLGTRPPFALDASLGLHPNGRASDVPAVEIAAHASGDLTAFDLDVHANAQASRADARLRIAPLAAQPVSAIDAALHAFDVRALFARAPQIVLDGTLKASTQGDGRLRGPFEFTNGSAGTLDRNRVPLAKIAGELVASPQRWWLDGFVADLGKAGELGGTGWVSAREAGFVLTTAGVDLHAVHPALRTTHLAGELFTSGPFDRQRMRVALADRNVALRGDALYEPRKLTVNDVALRAGGGRFAASGSLALDAAHAFALKTSFRGFDPSQFGNLKKAQLNGHLAARGELAPVLHVRADGRLSNSTLFGLPVSAEGNWASKDANDPTIGFDFKAKLGHTNVAARGALADPSHLQALDAAIDLGGDDLQELYTITGLPFPSTPAYRLRGRLALKDGVWSLRGFDGTVGDSDLAGDFAVDLSHDKPFVRASLTSRNLDMTDLGGFIGHDYHAPDPAPDKLLPHYPFRLDKLNAADVDVRLTGRHFRNQRLPLERLEAHLVLRDGRLTLDPLRFGAAGGDIDAHVAMDARRAPIRTLADIEVRRLQLAKLAPGVKAVMASVGTIDGRTVLTMSGDSFARMLGSADGNLMLAMDGGSMSDLVLRLADLDIANAIAAVAKGDESIPLRCVVADFRADGGVLTPRILVLDSEHTLIDGEGKIDLGTEALGLRLVAQPKDGSLFALRGPIRLDGTLKHPAVHPELGQAIARTGAAIVLGAIAPPAAILPFLQAGEPQTVDCSALTQQAKAFVEAAKAPLAPPRQAVASAPENGAAARPREN